MTDLIEFLRARLDEDEAVAQEAEGCHWRPTRPYLGGVDMDDVERNRSVIMDREGGAMSEETGAHVARWDPARVLAEIEAKRRILAIHADVTFTPDWLENPPTFHSCERCGTSDEYPVDWPCDTVRALVQPYADHAGFNRAWLLLTPAS